MTTNTIPIIDWQSRLASRMGNMKSSAIREILKIACQPDVISFAGGLPAAELFPLREIDEACRFIISQYGSSAMQYSLSEGHPPLREFLSSSMHKYGVPATTNNVLVVCGAQQALDLVGKVFLAEKDSVIVSRPTYLGALQAWDAYGAQYYTVNLDEHGMVVDEVEAVYHRIVEETGRAPKFVYVLPNFHNPAGTTLIEERRQRLCEIAQRLDLVIIEDDPYGQLRYEGKDVPPICSFAPERVIYLGTFSKTLTPGLRLGWIVAPEKIISRFVQVKQGADLHTGTFVQMIAHDIASRGLLKQHVKKLRSVYNERRLAMLQALESWNLSDCTWTRPEGGLFLWIRLPHHLDANKLFYKAIEKKVAFVAGSNFYPNGGGQNTMRLNFSFSPPPIIEEGINRLGEVIHEALG